MSKKHRVLNLNLSDYLHNPFNSQLKKMKTNQHKSKNKDKVVKKDNLKQSNNNIENDNNNIKEKNIQNIEIIQNKINIYNINENRNKKRIKEAKINNGNILKSMDDNPENVRKLEINMIDEKNDITKKFIIKGRTFLYNIRYIKKFFFMFIN